MSMPHTGKLEALINGQRCFFDGDTWTSNDRTLAATLNEWMQFIPTTHIPIQSRAELLFRRAGLTDAKIVSAVNDQWSEDLPDGAID